MTARRFSLIAPKILTLTLAFATFSGCAGISYKRAEDKSVNGIRYYRPATYFLVTADYTKGVANIQTFHLPDTSTPYAMDPSSWLADNKTKITFTDGMLSKLESTVDATSFPETVIKAATAVAKSTLEQLAKQAELAAKLKGGPALAKTAEGKAELPKNVFLFMAADKGLIQLYPPVTKATSEKPKGNEPKPGQSEEGKDENQKR